MTTPTIDPLTMSRLALIRLLYLQGVDQSRLPAPLVYSSVLTFHDAAELFLGLAADQLGANLSDHLAFMKYWDELSPKKLGARGVDLAGRGGMDRLNRLHNGFKHADTLPGLPAVEQARAEVTSFLEDNTTMVFAIDFVDIDMADVVPDQAIRDELKAAAAENRTGDRIEAMALLVEALRHVFDPRTRTPFLVNPSTIGRDYLFGPMPEYELGKIFTGIGQHRILSQGDLVQQISEMMRTTSALQDGMRVLALGIDFPKYHRFRTITPGVSMTYDGRRHIGHAPTYAPRSEDFDWCYRFVIIAALRAAEVQTDLEDIPDESKAAGTRQY